MINPKNNPENIYYRSLGDILSGVTWGLPVVASGVAIYSGFDSSIVDALRETGDHVIRILESQNAIAEEQNAIAERGNAIAAERNAIAERANDIAERQLNQRLFPNRNLNNLNIIDIGFRIIDTSFRIITNLINLRTNLNNTTANNESSTGQAPEDRPNEQDGDK